MQSDKAYLSTRERFNDKTVAASYVIKKNHLDSSKNRREIRCIERALERLPAGASVLDIPCGSGRLEPMLTAKGFKVIAADYSEPMLEQARQAYRRHPSFLEAENDADVSFDKQDVLKTSYESNAFDAIVCNRLLHHYPQAELRREVFAELARISRGVIIVSYYSNFALSSLKFHLVNFVRRRTAMDRIPIWFSTFQRDFETVGLRCVATYPVRYGVSPQTYLKLSAT